MKVTLTISVAEVTTILSALSAVEPFGGGSDVKALFEKIAEETDLEEDMNQVQQMIADVLENAADAEA